MATQQITIIDAANNTQIERPLNEQELAQRDLDQTAAQTQADKAAAKAEARQNVLDKLGLTADEAAALLGQFGVTRDIDRLRNNTRQHTYSQVTGQKHDAR